MTTETITEESQTTGELFGHPKGLYICFATELWERFSFYGMKYLLLLYLTKYHLFSDNQGYDVLGAYAGLVYALPVIGGIIADRYLGMRKAVLFGGILLSLGHIAMAWEGHQAVEYAAGTILSADLTLSTGEILQAGTTLKENIKIQDTAALKVFYFALSLIIVGVGFLKPNISTIVGKLYSANDPRRDSGFTIFYMGINLGSFTATLICGWLGENYGWGYGFGLAGIGMIAGLLTFLWGQKYLHGYAEPSNPAILKEKVFGLINKEWLIYILSVASISLVWLLVQHEPIVHSGQYALLLVSVVGLLIYAMFFNGEHTDKTKAYFIAGVALITGMVAIGLGLLHDESKAQMIETLNYVCIASVLGLIVYGVFSKRSKEFLQMAVLMVLILSTIMFWALFEQSASSMTLYADRVLDRDLMGTEIKASMFGSLNAGFIILLAPIFAFLWVWLSKKNLEPNTPIKFGLGIVQAGLGFGALVIGATMPNEAGKVGMIWLVLAYLLHTTGELCLSPVGLSAVTKLSIPRVVGLSMGTWFLATALSETVATRLAKSASVAPDASIAEQLATYTNLYTDLMWWGVGTGIVLIILSPILKKGMGNIH
jgi:proton-dependent oligopeptide transporter, POT family